MSWHLFSSSCHQSVDMVCLVWDIALFWEKRKSTYYQGLLILGWIYIRRTRHQDFTIQILLEQLIFVFLRVYVYWLFLIRCVFPCDFGKDSCYSMDSKSLFIVKKCLHPIQKQGASMNGYMVWIFSFYPIFFRWFLC